MKEVIMDKGAYYFELYFVVSPSLINRKFLLPFPSVDEAVVWVESIKLPNEGYYMRWKSPEEIKKLKHSKSKKS
jgi:hypothetical protein